MIDFILLNSVSDFSFEKLKELHPEATVSKNGRSGTETLMYIEKKDAGKNRFRQETGMLCNLRSGFPASLPYPPELFVVSLFVDCSRVGISV